MEETCLVIILSCAVKRRAKHKKHVWINEWLKKSAKYNHLNI